MNIVTYPDKRLLSRCTTVEDLRDTIDIAAQMMALVERGRNILGVAANQVGDTRRIIVVKDPSTGELHAMINPVIESREGPEVRRHEGCLSFPRIALTIPRPDRIKLVYTTPIGEAKEVEAEGMFATVIQHEVDHLDGVVFTQRASAMQRDMVRRKLRKRRGR